LSRELSKIIQIVQNNAAKLDTVLENQEKFEVMMNTHDTRISELSTKVDHNMKEDRPVEPKKEKGKGVKNEFYYVNIYNTIIVNILHYIFMPFLILIIA
jgi:hypothetical protein